jgi:hypothetical protein
MKPFAVRLSVDRPVALNNLLHLDAVLGKRLIDRGGTLEALPLARDVGVWCASAALLETGPFGGSEFTIPRLKALRRGHFPDGLVDALPPPARTIGDMSPFRPRLRPYTAWRGISAVWFVARGDREAVIALLSEVHGVGAMTSTGYGRITDINILDIPDTGAVGLTLADGLPARTIPLTIWNALGLPRHPRAVVSDQRWQPPYWTGTAAPCMMPTQIDLTGARDDIRGMLGL